MPQAEPSRGGVHLTRTSPEEEGLTTLELGEQAKVPPALSIVYSTGNLLGLSKVRAWSKGAKRPKIGHSHETTWVHR